LRKLFLPDYFASKERRFPNHGCPSKSHPSKEQDWWKTKPGQHFA
jgi:hypothetical protein